LLPCAIEHVPTTGRNCASGSEHLQQGCDYALLHHDAIRDWPGLADRHLRVRQGVPPGDHHLEALRGLQHHHRWKANDHHQLQDLDVHACNYLDQHFVFDFFQQAVHNLVDQVFHVFHEDFN
jgi:hypothetical protein